MHTDEMDCITAMRRRRASFGALPGIGMDGLTVCMHDPLLHHVCRTEDEKAAQDDESKFPATRERNDTAWKARRAQQR